jgi:hypothetical protein
VVEQSIRKAELPVPLETLYLRGFAPIPLPHKAKVAHTVWNTAVIQSGNAAGHNH